MSRRTGYITPGMGGGSGFVPGHWQPDAPTGKPIKEEGGRTPPPAPVNSSNGAVYETSQRADDVRAREATAQNIAAREAALAPRRWRPPEERS